MRALIIVDVQNDFCPGGALAVKEGDQVVPVINRIAPRFDLVVASQDWHPANHLSFASQHPGKRPGERIELKGTEQVLWPVHCVQHSRGAELVSALDISLIEAVFRKGTDREIDSYSVFFDNARRKKTDLEEYLRLKGVRELWVTGLATDYCVKFSVLDALSLGFKTTLIQDACRGVELENGDVERALREMRTSGACLVTSGSLE